MNRFLFLLAAIVLPDTRAWGASSELPYEYIRIGSISDVTARADRGVVLAGGGVDVDDAFKWMCALSGNGDFLVIRAKGTDAYDAYIGDLCPDANSVATLIVHDRAGAFSPSVAKIVSRAEAIWFAGGDQDRYIRDWNGTPLQRAIQSSIDRGVPVGGTSAGLQIMTSFVYSAEMGKGITSAQALADPLSPLVTLRRNFVSIPLLANTLGDPHFSSRDRMGRAIDFLGQVYLKGWSHQPRGIEVDEGTALLIDATGNARVAGTGSVYFLNAPHTRPVFSVHSPLTYRDVKVYRISTGAEFFLPTWTGHGGTAYTVSALSGRLTSTQPGEQIY